MVSASASEGQVEAVATVLRDAGFKGECAAELGAQGGGIEAVMLDIVPRAFLAGLVGAAGADAWKRVKRLMRELREAFGEPEGSHVQLYLRPDAITKVEFERSDRKVGPPGFHRDPGGHPEDLLVTTRCRMTTSGGSSSPSMRTRPDHRSPQTGLAAGILRGTQPLGIGTATSSSSVSAASRQFVAFVVAAEPRPTSGRYSDRPKRLPVDQGQRLGLVDRLQLALGLSGCRPSTA